MSIIGICGIPSKMSLRQFVRKLSHVLNCPFEAFDSPHKTSIKTFYLKLPEKLDPFKTITVINGARFPYQLDAFMPSSSIVPSKTKKIHQRLRKVLRIPRHLSTRQLIETTHQQIMIEMLSKYTQLFELSKTTNHQLLLILWQILYQRLGCMQTTTAGDSCFSLSKCYRKNYPHSKDFELIRDVFSKIQKCKGIDFQEINENEFCSYKDEDIGDGSILGNEKLDSICNQYSDSIVSKIMDHMQNFSTDIDIRPNNQQDLIRAEVRQHINNMAPTIPTIVRTIIRNKLMTKSFSQPYEVLRVYGEPFLPNREVMNPVLRKTGYTSLQRSETIFNLYTIKIPITKYLDFIKCDGTVVSGARLVVRPLMAKKHLAQLKEIRGTTPESNVDVRGIVQEMKK